MTHLGRHMAAIVKLPFDTSGVECEFLESDFRELSQTPPRMLGMGEHAEDCPFKIWYKNAMGGDQNAHRLVVLSLGRAGLHSVHPDIGSLNREQHQNLSRLASSSAEKEVAEEERCIAKPTLDDTDRVEYNSGRSGVARAGNGSVSSLFRQPSRYVTGEKNFKWSTATRDGNRWVVLCPSKNTGPDGKWPVNGLLPLTGVSSAAEVCSCGGGKCAQEKAAAEATNQPEEDDTLVSTGSNWKLQAQVTATHWRRGAQIHTKAIEWKLGASGRGNVLAYLDRLRGSELLAFRLPHGDRKAIWYSGKIPVTAAWLLTNASVGWESVKSCCLEIAKRTIRFQSFANCNIPAVAIENSGACTILEYMEWVEHWHDEVEMFTMSKQKDRTSHSPASPKEGRSSEQDINWDDDQDYEWLTQAGEPVHLKTENRFQEIIVRLKATCKQFIDVQIPGHGLNDAGEMMGSGPQQEMWGPNGFAGAGLECGCATCRLYKAASALAVHQGVYLQVLQRIQDDIVNCEVTYEDPVPRSEPRSEERGLSPSTWGETVVKADLELLFAQERANLRLLMANRLKGPILSVLLEDAQKMFDAIGVDQNAQALYRSVGHRSLDMARVESAMLQLAATFERGVPRASAAKFETWEKMAARLKLFLARNHGLFPKFDAVDEKEDMLMRWVMRQRTVGRGTALDGEVMTTQKVKTLEDACHRARRKDVFRKVRCRKPDRRWSWFVACLVLASRFSFLVALSHARPSSVQVRG